MEQVKVSIIIPIYKVEKYLDRCIESIITQMDNSLEVVLVDDGSPDRCPQICDEYASKYKNFKVLHKKNGGLADAVKTGTLASTGTYIAYVDSDDWLEEGWYGGIKSVLNDYADIDTIMYGFQRVIKDIKQTNNPYSLLNEGYYDSSSIETVKKTYMKPGGVGPTRWNKVYSREIALKCLEYYDIRVSIGEDMIFSSIATDMMKSTYIIRKCFVNYYINDGSMTQHFNEKYITSFDYLYRTLERYFYYAPVLSYLNFVNMKTMVNALGNSEFKNKTKYLKEILNSVEIHERLNSVSEKELDMLNKIILRLMLKGKARSLLFVGGVYRKIR